MIIRSETEADVGAIGRVHDAAFGQYDEALIVDRVRGTDDWIEGGSLVAVEAGGRIVGHLLLTRGALVDATGQHAVWMVGPVAVLPERQRRGIGSLLMHSAISLARSRGAPALCLLGHTDYYRRFGYEPARPLGIEPPGNWPEDAWLVLRLAGWTPELRGVARYAPAFGVT